MTPFNVLMLTDVHVSPMPHALERAAANVARGLNTVAATLLVGRGTSVARVLHSSRLPLEEYNVEQVVRLLDGTLFGISLHAIVAFGWPEDHAFRRQCGPWATRVTSGAAAAIPLVYITTTGFNSDEEIAHVFPGRNPPEWFHYFPTRRRLTQDVVHFVTGQDAVLIKE